MINLGKLNQITIIVGYIPHELVLATNESGIYSMKFNIRTYDDEDVPCLIPCIATGTMAKTLYDEFEEKDALVIWGQLRHTYMPKVNDTRVSVKVISYSIIVDLEDNLYEPSMSVEKKTFLKKAAEMFDNNSPLPTDEEVAYWRQHWADRKKKAFEEKIAKERKTSGMGDGYGK